MRNSIFISIVLLLSTIFFNFGINKDNGEEILYYLPEQVENNINEYLLQSHLDNTSKLVCIWQSNRDTIDLTLFDFSKLYNEDFEKIHKISNREIKIKRTKIPIVFYSDFEFSSIFNKLNSDKTVTTSSNSLFGGYYVKFTGRFMSGRLIYSGIDR